MGRAPKRLWIAAGIIAVLAAGAVVALDAPPPARPPAATHAGPARYISMSGSDSNPGTRDAPWRTLGASLPKLRPGETLYVRGGTYVERILNPGLAAGTPAAPITVRVYPGERAVIQGLLWLEGLRHWTLDGLNVAWDDETGRPSEHMVKLTNGVGWRITNAEIWGARSFAGILVDGSKSGEPADWRIDHNCIHDTHPSNDTNQDHNIYVNTGLSAGPGLIERNVIFNAVNGENIKLDSDSTGPDEGTTNVTVRFNTMSNAAQPILIGNGSHDNEIYGNIFEKGLRGYMIRGYRLLGAGNVAHGNLWHDSGAANRFIYNDSSTTTGIRDGGRNVNRSSRFDGVGCGHFHPQADLARAYGVYASTGSSTLPAPGSGQSIQGG